MSGRNVDFGDRLATAAAAKQALLEKAKAKANDPELAKRAAERAVLAAAREAREAERRAIRKAEQERIAAERAAEAARKAEEAAAEAERIKQGKRPVSRPALSAEEQKALRDARYAARKARVKGR